MAVISKLVSLQYAGYLLRNLYCVCIHTATFHKKIKKIDFKTDSFLRLFTDIHLGTCWRLPDSFKSLFFYNMYWSILPLPFGAGVRGNENKFEMTNMQLKL